MHPIWRRPVKRKLLLLYFKASDKNASDKQSGKRRCTNKAMSKKNRTDFLHRLEFTNTLLGVSGSSSSAQRPLKETAAFTIIISHESVMRLFRMTYQIYDKLPTYTEGSHLTLRDHF